MEGDKYHNMETVLLSKGEVNINFNFFQEKLNCVKLEGND